MTPDRPTRAFFFPCWYCGTEINGLNAADYVVEIADRDGMRTEYVCTLCQARHGLGEYERAEP